MCSICIGPQLLILSHTCPLDSSPERLTILIPKVASGICLLQSDCFSINYPVHFAAADTHIIIKASLNHYKFHLAAYYMMAVQYVCARGRVCFLDKLTEC